jgi:hypothetical protein
MPARMARMRRPRRRWAGPLVWAREAMGLAGGVALAPLAALGSTVRRARLFHPEGVVYRAEVRPLVTEGPAGAVARRLAGPALVRLSNAWWRGGKEWIDVLGCAVRFRHDARPSTAAAPDDQDMLFATIRWPWTTPIAPLATDPHSFLHDDYHGVSPFEVRELGLVKWRLRSPGVRGTGPDRAARLERAVRDGTAVLRLEVRRKVLGAPFEPIAAIELRERAPLDQAAMRFDPFRAGRGVHPRGFVQALRVAAYAASQRARPRRSRPARHA